MTKFNDLKDLRQERLRLHEVCRNYDRTMLTHWGIVKDPEFRKQLMGSAFNEAIRSVKPLRMAASVLKTDKGAAGSLLGSALGKTGGSIQGKALGWAAGLAIPFIISLLTSNERGEKLSHDLVNIWTNIKNKFSREDKEV